MLGMFETNNAVFSTTLFELFWSGQFQDAFVFFNKATEAVHKTKWWSISDLGNAFVSAVVSKNDIDAIFQYYPLPLEPWELPLVVRHQRLKEASDNKHVPGLLAQPKYINKALFAAAIGLEKGGKHFVETGTYCGTSCYLLAKCFETVTTIEAQPYLHE